MLMMLVIMTGNSGSDDNGNGDGGGDRWLCQSQRVGISDADDE